MLLGHVEFFALSLYLLILLIWLFGGLCLGSNLLPRRPHLVDGYVNEVPICVKLSVSK